MCDVRERKEVIKSCMVYKCVLCGWRSEEIGSTFVVSLSVRKGMRIHEVYVW